MKVLFLNFGHKSTPVVSSEDKEVVRYDFTIQLDNPADGKELHDRAIELAEKIAPVLTEKLPQGYTPVIGLPGASGMAVSLIMAITGLIGYAPSCVTGSKKDSGFVYNLNKLISPQETREKTRALRTKYEL